MKKKILSALAIGIVLAMTLGLAAACGGGGQQGGGQPTTQAPGSPAPGIAQQPAPPPIIDPGPADTGLVQTRTSVLNLTFAHPNPATHHQHTGVIMPFVEAFMEATEGMVNVIVHPGGALTTSLTALDDVITGAIDMTWTIPGWNPGRFPLAEMIEFPNHFNSGVEAVEVIWDLLENNADFAAEFESLRVFCIYGTPTAEIWSNGRPVRTPADMPGLIIRSPSAMAERTMQAAGAATINMPMGEAYDSLDRGVVTGIAADPSAIPTWSLWEVVDYGAKGLNLYTSIQMFAMSWDAWNLLNEFEQDAFVRLADRHLSRIAGEFMQDISDNAWEQIAETGMVEVYELTPADLAMWDATMLGAIDAYKDSLTSRGLNAAGVYADMIAFRDARR